MVMPKLTMKTINSIRCVWTQVCLRFGEHQDLYFARKFDDVIGASFPIFCSTFLLTSRYILYFSTAMLATNLLSTIQSREIFREYAKLC